MSYHFNGQEKDDEVYGKGNSTTAEYWQYDSRLGRRWNIDPVVKSYESPFTCIGDTPIRGADPKGNDWIKTSNGTYEFDPNVHSQEDATKAYPGSLWHTDQFDVSYSDGSSANFRNDGSIFFSSEQRAYNFMWENSTAKGQTKETAKENSAIITPNGVLVLPSYGNTAGSAGTPNDYGYKLSGTDQSNMTVTRTSTGETFRMIGYIHTHPTKIPGKASVLSDADIATSKFFNGVPMISMESNGTVQGVYFKEGDGYLGIDFKNISRDELRQGKEKLIPYLKKYGDKKANYPPPGTK